MFFWNALAFSVTQRVLEILFLVSLPILNPNLSIWQFLVDILLKPSLKDFEHYFATLWKEHNCMVVWTFFGIALLWDWNENWPFPVLWPLLSFPNLLTYFRIWNNSAGIRSPPLALFIVDICSQPTWLHNSGCLALGECLGEPRICNQSLTLRPQGEFSQQMCMPSWVWTEVSHSQTPTLSLVGIKEKFLYSLWSSQGVSIE